METPVAPEDTPLAKRATLFVVLALTLLIIAPVARGLFGIEAIWLPCVVAGVACLVVAVVLFALYVAKGKPPTKVK